VSNSRIQDGRWYVGWMLTSISMIQIASTATGTRTPYCPDRPRNSNGALSLTRRAEGPVENRIIFGSPRSARERYLARAVFRQRRSSNANSLCGQNSAGFLQICRTFKGIICGDVSEFESHMPSQPVLPLWAMSGLQKYMRLPQRSRHSAPRRPAAAR
jgi:hypothetical protein